MMIKCKKNSLYLEHPQKKNPSKTTFLSSVKFSYHKVLKQEKLSNNIILLPIPALLSNLAVGIYFCITREFLATLQPASCTITMWKPTPHLLLRNRDDPQNFTCPFDRMAIRSPENNKVSHVITNEFSNSFLF